MNFERGQAYLISYQNGGKGRATYRVVLVCSLRDLITKGVVLATPIRKLAEWEAERELCEQLGCVHFAKRPNPQTYYIERVKHVKTAVKDYRHYMDAKVKNIVKHKLDMIENAR